MTCDQARDALLVADLRELASGSSDLADHLSACADCRGHADVVIARTATLASMVRRRARRRRSRQILAIVALPIAASLITVAILRLAAPEPAISLRRSSSLPVARHVSLTVARGQMATVLKTVDPSVTVIWLSPGVGQ